MTAPERTAAETRAWAEEEGLTEHCRRLVEDWPPLPEPVRAFLREAGRARRARRLDAISERGSDDRAAG